ncbi:MAG: hypothetical protein JKY00_13255 [Roseicyclus sp.]|nr:hypothetical protein [Roseicyclus sp.]
MANERKDDRDDVAADIALDGVFAQARDEAPDPELMARVMADAMDVQSQLAAPPAPAARTPDVGWLAALIGSVGGWSAVSGITAAGVMGLAVGLYSPDTVADWLESDTLPLGISAYDLTPDMGALWTEDGDV